MGADLIKAKREEVLRLITKQNKLLSHLLQIPNIFQESDEDEQQRTDSQTVELWQGILTNEAQKVNRLEMVVVVVGSMKAGKSTTINAIVGLELLPSSNRAMTSSPTLIRHCVGQRQPVLSFPKNKQMEKMVEEIKQKLIDLKNKNNLNLVELSKYQDGDVLIQSIIDGKFRKFQERYEGQDNILNCLKLFNELIRLSLDKNVMAQALINGYENINDLPTIEVEFLHLPEKNEITKGSLTLLDTPGSNEFVIGKELRKALRAQIAKASALLAIIHYGQMGSDGEGQMREELENQIHQIKDTFFIFANRFDERDRNTMKAEEVKSYAAKSFMKGQVKQECVYPVSATYAFLSNRAKYEIKEKGKLPDYRDEENKWVEDFGKAVFGVFWEDKIQKKDEVEAGAKGLWDLSGFKQPIDEVVVKAESTAALASMKSATDKMIESVNSLQNFLESRRWGLSQSIDKIRQAIDDLKQDIQKVGQAETTANKALQELMDEFLSTAQTIYKDVEQDLRPTLEDYFQKRKKKEEKESQRQEQDFEEALQKLENRGIREIFKEIEEERGKRPESKGISEILQEIKRDKVLPKHKKDFDFDPKNPKIEFRSEEDAKSFLKTVNRSVISIIDDSVKKLRLRLRELSKELEQKIPQTLKNKVEGILQTAQERLRNEGFSLGFDLPEPEIEQNDIDLVELFVLGMEKSTKSLPSPELREMKAWWAGIARFFGKFFDHEWGYEAYIEHKKTDVYIVDMTKIRKSVIDNLHIRIDELRDENQDFFDETIKPISEKYFGALKDYLEIIRGDLSGSIEIQKLDRQDKKNLLQLIYDLREETELQTQDLNLLKGGLKSK
ncbi:MAG: dynamin family protein [Tolypothrix brevis GSE-NOS-MK-07-07A]|jgi:GTPase SAR1 family protein|nr:dynamin family protein [Tolypothrix brevis GSE-NOS-MK-07-07A]